MSHQLVHLEQLYFGYSSLQSKLGEDEPLLAPLTRFRHFTHPTLEANLLELFYFSNGQMQQLRCLSQVKTMIEAGLTWGN